MLSQAMKGEALKGITAALVSLLFGVLGYLVAGRFSSTSLEYKIAVKESYFAVPNPMKDGLQIQFQGKTLSNVSVIDVGIFNRVRDLGTTTVYFKLTPKKDRLPQTISAEVVPPLNIANVGIDRVSTNDPSLIAFRFSTLKRQSSKEYYLVKLIFEGEEAPAAQVITNEKDVLIGPYKEWRDWVIAGFWVTLFYAILIGAGIAFDSKRSKKRREQQVKDYEVLAMRQHQHQTPDVKVPLIAVSDAVQAYREFIEPKPGFFSKLFRRGRASMP